MDSKATLNQIIELIAKDVASMKSTGPLDPDMSHRLIDYAKVMLSVTEKIPQEPEHDYSKLSDKELQALLLEANAYLGIEAPQINRKKRNVQDKKKD